VIFLASENLQVSGQVSVFLSAFIVVESINTFPIVKTLREAAHMAKVEETIGSTLHSGSYSFEWTSLHLPRSETDPLRYEYDTLGANALAKLQEIAKAKGFTDDPRKRPDLYQLLVENHDSCDELRRFWEQVNTVPEWVDWAQLERGQRFFYRYAAANLMGFALQGFVGENSAAVSSKCQSPRTAHEQG
jgi:hypothetical protein